MNTLSSPAVDHMPALDQKRLAAATLSVSWTDARARHEEQLHVEKFSVWREADFLPAEIGNSLAGMRAGDQVATALQPGELTDRWHSTRVITTRPSRFDRHHRRGLEVEPRLGRFYPQGFFHRVSGMRSEAVQPARITELTAERMDIDLNHPLARFPLQVQFRLDRVLPGFDRRGGRCNSPLDELLQYPGLAAPLASGLDTDYGADEKGLSRMDEREDAVFYAGPRLVQHLDTLALDTVNSLYRRLIPAQADVLDLMASFDSHLNGIPTASLHVLGMNAEELAANRAAGNRLLQDLNESPELPFEASSMDTIVCTASIEYLTRPAGILAEALRILRPGGVLAITFSNRWFPTKAIRIWSELQEFERVGMVTQWLQQAGFTNLHTFSSRGWPRPENDPHAAETPWSDPVYAIWGYRPAT